MGILPAPKTDDKAAPASNKRRSLNPDFSALPPLTAGSGAGFSNFRDSTAASSAGGRKKSGAAADQDSDDEGEVIDGGVKLGEDVDVDVDGDGDTGISPTVSGEDQGELAEAVRKIKVCEPNKIYSELHSLREKARIYYSFLFFIHFLLPSRLSFPFFRCCRSVVFLTPTSRSCINKFKKSLNAPTLPTG
jgi:hypothetical protein